MACCWLCLGVSEYASVQSMFVVKQCDWHEDGHGCPSRQLLRCPRMCPCLHSQLGYNDQQFRVLPVRPPLVRASLLIYHLDAVQASSGVGAKISQITGSPPFEVGQSRFGMRVFPGVKLGSTFLPSETAKIFR